MLLDGNAVVCGPLRALHGLQIGQGHPALIRPAPAFPGLQHVHHRAHGVRPHLAVTGAGAAADVDADAGRHLVLAHTLLLVWRLLAALRRPDTQIALDTLTVADTLAVPKVAVGGAACVEAQSPQVGRLVVPAADAHQLVPQPLRRLGVRRAVAGAVQDHPRPGQQDGGAPPCAPVLRGVAEGLTWPSGGCQQLNAADVVPAARSRHNL